MLIFLWAYLSHQQDLSHFLNQHLLSLLFISFLFSFFITLIFSKTGIKKLAQLQLGQVVRDNGPKTHLGKKGTPTMGGVLIILAITLSGLLFGDLKNLNLYLMLFTLISAGLVGFYDDFKKIVLKNTKGLSGRKKMFFLSLIALISTAWLINLKADTPAHLSLYIPIIHSYIHLGIFFFLFGWLVIVGSSNAVNLTDGLDGLVIFPVILVSLGLGLLAYFHPALNFQDHLKNLLDPSYFSNNLSFIFNILIISAAILGSGLGFLFFNAHPAQVFMGDVGALALGALLAIMAMLINQEIIFAIMSLIFIMEALSVMLQVGSYKLRKKRIFKMAPLHHHFELLGWKETKVTSRFWILAVLFLIIGLFLGLF